MMIASVQGTLEARRAGHVIVRVGGFGIRVFTPTTTLSRLGEVGSDVSLYTHFYVREDGMALYGFSTEEDRDAFERLIGISGVGPKVALALLSMMDAQTFYQAIANEDQQRLALTPGVGKKLAARLVLELKGKLPAMGVPASNGALSPSGTLPSEVIEALMGLGFTATEAQSALSKLPHDRPMTLEEQITFALRSFARES